ncbi:VanZ family protein [Tenacibaculum finnmarkense]|uniref:VanZ family protein n=1 Tax=Tenacibaculum finnmarkense TaxID=2781243 RepID=UPI001EFA5923
MLKRIKSLLKDNLTIIAILISIGIAILSLIKIRKPPAIIQIKNLDKYEHAFAYFVLCFVWLIAFDKTKINKIIIVLCCLFYGIIIEGLQVTITTYRSGDVLDIVANTTGILIAYMMYFLFLRKM